ncbi:MAG: sugar hydrolase [Clostridia bacterium]|nr:sugar hydrolase [Clostridia bacterium]
MKDRNYYLAKAEENMPKIIYSELKPEASQEVFKKGDSILLDLGNHYVGHFSFRLDAAEYFICAPVKMKIRFAEDSREVDDDFSSYDGDLPSSWLQEETVILDHHMTVDMPRRYACRYIKITVEATEVKVKLSDFKFLASTSADMDSLKAADIKDEELRKIDEIAINTLKNCMQTLFEDGPKRDRRLWIGDLRLEALANYCTFDNREIVKRCLHLIAAGECNELGFLPSYIFETPEFHTGWAHLSDYALLYVVTLCDYYKNTKDIDTVNDLLDLCKSQLKSFRNILDENLIVVKQKGWFVFIDWCKGLKSLTALQGVYLYTLEKFTELLESIGDSEKEAYEKHLDDVRKASRKHLFDEEKGVFVNATDEYQKSVHSQVWMILGGVIEGKEAEKALKTMLKDAEAKQPFTPYMRHYIVEAMLKIGLKDEAFSYIKEIWGGMIKLGADTFYEVYVPGDPDFSPYRDRMINSLCHAWSCTPTYFIRNEL